jgi:hypothetical protein
MKIFCMSCGRGSEYIGEHNKPDACVCGEDFNNPTLEASPSTSKATTPHQKRNTPRGSDVKSFVIEGKKFDIMALAKSLTPEFVVGYAPDTQEESLKE